MPKLLVFGGTGLVGRGVLEAASDDPSVTVTIALQRRKVAPPLPRVELVRVTDFGDLSSHRDSFAGADGCIFALGISQTQVDEQEYRRITIDYPLAAARLLGQMNPRSTFLLVSGQGADPSGKSVFLFGRVKGEAEKRIRQAFPGRTLIARPAMVVPKVAASTAPFTERLKVPLGRALAALIPSATIPSRDLGSALVRAAFDPSILGVLENRDLRRLAGLH